MLWEHGHRPLSRNGQQEPEKALSGGRDPKGVLKDEEPVAGQSEQDKEDSSASSVPFSSRISLECHLFFPIEAFHPHPLKTEYLIPSPVSFLALFFSLAHIITWHFTISFVYCLLVGRLHEDRIFLTSAGSCISTVYILEQCLEQSWHSVSSRPVCRSMEVRENICLGKGKSFYMA